jgi:Domain of unknown function (DUF5668)
MTDTPNPAPPTQPAPPPPPAAPLPAAHVSPAPPLPAFSAPLPAGYKKPAVAGLLSALPGVGHLYLGLYQRAAAFFSIWVLIIAFVDRAPHSGPLPIFIPFWWFFVLIDAVRQAHAINATGAPEANLVTGEKPIKVQGSLAFGIFLILFGAFFLLDRFVTIDLSFLLDWWPAAVILFGAWQVFTYYKGKKNAEGAGDTTEKSV